MKGAYRQIGIELPEATRLIDIRCIQADLRFCAEAYDLYKGHAATGGPNLVPQCITHAIIVRYVRCFNRGKRMNKDSTLLDSLSPEELEVHQLFYKFRDRHVGHSVSALESAQVFVILAPEESERKILNVGILSHFVSAPTLEEFGKLAKLIDRLLQMLEAEAAKEQRKLVRVLEKRYTLDEIYAMKGVPLEWAPTLNSAKVKAALFRDRGVKEAN